MSATVASASAFDADIGIDSVREIREYFIPDFSNWKDHDSYQTAFRRLVKDLKAVDSGLVDCGQLTVASLDDDPSTGTYPWRLVLTHDHPIH